VQLCLGSRGGSGRGIRVLGAVATAAFAGFAGTRAGFAAAGAGGLVSVGDGVDVHCGHWWWWVLRKEVWGLGGVRDEGEWVEVGRL